MVYYNKHSYYSLYYISLSVNLFMEIWAIYGNQCGNYEKTIWNFNFLRTSRLVLKVVFQFVFLDGFKTSVVELASKICFVIRKIE